MVNGDVLRTLYGCQGVLSMGFYEFHTILHSIQNRTSAFVQLATLGLVVVSGSGLGGLARVG